VQSVSSGIPVPGQFVQTPNKRGSCAPKRWPGPLHRPLCHRTPARTRSASNLSLSPAAGSPPVRPSHWAGVCPAANIASQRSAAHRNATQRCRGLRRRPFRRALGIRTRCPGTGVKPPLLSDPLIVAEQRFLGLFVSANSSFKSAEKRSREQHDPGRRLADCDGTQRTRGPPCASAALDPRPSTLALDPRQRMNTAAPRLMAHQQRWRARAHFVLFSHPSARFWPPFPTARYPVHGSAGCPAQTTSVLAPSPRAPPQDPD
jgi:hypothetical protein